MNKLVSRNPVQRFKKGKKIVKAQWGLKTREDGVIVNSAGIPVGKSIMGSSYEYEKYFPEDKLILPGLYQDKDTKEIFSTNSTDSNGNYNQVISGPSPIQNGTYYETKNASGKIIDRGRYFGGKKLSLPIGPKSKESSQNNSNQKIINTSNQKTANNGAPVKAKKTITAPINNRWVNGVQRRNDITDVRATQQMLKDMGFDIGKFGVDGKWGKDTERAYNEYLQKNAPTLPTSEQLIQQVTQNTPVIEEVPQTGTDSIQNQLMAMQEATKQGILPATGTYIINPTLPKANRSDIREVIRRATGKGAYDFTGAQRKALRQYINGEQYNADDLAAFGNLDIFNKYKPGFYKQGGNILPSRNIIERFKQRKFK